MVRRVVLFLAVVVVAFSAFRAVQAAAPLSTIANLDIDGNGKADFVVFRPTARSWFIQQGPAFTSAFSVASSSATANLETLLPLLDYNGDGQTDLGTYRPRVFGSSAPVGGWTFQLGPTYTSAFTVQFGILGDIPLAQDWDGDGRIDLAVWRPSELTLYVLQGGTNFTTAFTIRYGIRGDIPIPGDYDGDGRIDFAVWRRAENLAYILQGGTNFTTAFTSSLVQREAGIPVPGDYDGDGRLDLAVFAPITTGSANVAGTWTIAQGGNNFSTQFAVLWGTTNDNPVPGDFDGDGRLDIAVWRVDPATNIGGILYVLQGGSSFKTAFSLPWGINGDTPFGARNPVVLTVF